MNEKNLRKRGNPAVFFTDAYVYKTVGGISRPEGYDCEECDGM